MKKLLLIIAVFLLMLSLIACNTQPPENNDGTEGDIAGGETNDPPNETPEETPEETPDDNGEVEDESLLVLAKGGKAAFKFVTTPDSGASTIRNVDKTIQTLRKCGIEIENRISDQRADQVSECEVLVGLDIRFRGEEYSVSRADLGNRGYVIKVVGSRVVIAGGTPELTNQAFEIFKRDYLGITGEEESIKSLTVPKDLNDFHPTEYLISSIKVGGVDLSAFTLIIDIPDAEKYGISNIEQFSEILFDNSGYLLNVGNVSDMDNYEHRLIIRCNGRINEAYAEDGFAAYVDENGDLIVECTYANKFNDAFLKFAKATIYDVMGKISYTADEPYTDVVSRVYYSEFGAIGDGRTDDYIAMYSAHMFANQCGQTVCADPGENVAYYVHVFENGQIPVKTNVDLGNAKIIIDDRGSEVYVRRTKPLYNLVSDYSSVTYRADRINDTFGEVTLAVGQTNIPWLVGVLEADSLVMFVNAEHKDFVRNGSNQDSGYSRQDVVMVDVNGNVYEDTPIIFEFEKITQMQIYRTDDAPITFRGGYFETICCTVVEETHVNKYHSYQRGINVNRSNALVSGVTHRMTGEPDLDTTLSKYGTRQESYPYHAFLQYYYCYNSRAEDLDLTGHATYYEDKTTSSNPVPMGSYDFVLGTCIKITFTNVVQNGVPIHDSKYWGIMASNGVKNISFINCEISRFDAHRGFWNGTLINTTIGQTINVIGGGLMTCTDVTRMIGDNFINLRSDYGATFEGDMLFTNCTLSGYASYNSRNGGTLSTKAGYKTGYIVESGYASTDNVYLNWDFGFVCYMPQNIVLDNFKSGITSVSVFNKINNKAFDPANSNCYVLTKKITFKNMDRLNISPKNSGCTVLDSIPVSVE